MSRIDSFYPISEAIQSQSAVWQIGMIAKIAGHLERAKAGSRDAESRLINRIGQLRRNVDHIDSMQPDLIDLVKESTAWIRSTGRAVNFKAENPGMWITARDGRTPRF